MKPKIVQVIGVLSMVLCAMFAACAGAGGGGSVPGSTQANSPTATHTAVAKSTAMPVTPTAAKSTAIAVSPTVRRPSMTRVASTPFAAPKGERAKAVQLAKRKVARKTGVRPRKIKLISAKAEQWPNSALGCPKPGKMYSQIVTPGFRIVLKAKGHRYEVHTGRADQAVICKKPKQP